MNTYLLIANIISFLGNTLFTISALARSKKKILFLQSTNHGLSIISEYMMKAFSAMAQESVSLVRNVILLFVDSKRIILKTIITAICVVIAVTLGITFNVIFNDNIWYGYFPIIGNFVYSICVILAVIIKMKADNAELFIKSGLLVNSVLWSLYGFFVKLYPIFGFNILNFIFCVISIVRVLRIKTIKEELYLEEKNEI